MYYISKWYKYSRKWYLYYKVNRLTLHSKNNHNKQSSFSWLLSHSQWVPIEYHETSY